MKVLLLTVALAATPASSLAGTADVPLHIDMRHLKDQVSDALDLDAGGRARLVADSCNRVELADPQLTGRTRSLEISLALTVHSGVMAFGRCTGPRPVAGRFQVELEPGIGNGGRAIVFRPLSAAIRRPDGGAGFLARTASDLADRLIVPRLAAIEVDMSSSLLAIDALVEEFVPANDDGRSPLAERARLAEVNMSDDGLVALLAIGLQPMAQGDPRPEAPLDQAELAQWQRIEDELDGFLTTIIVRLAGQLDEREVQLDLLGVLVDARQRIAEALAADSADDPVEALFLDTWRALRPLLGRVHRLDIADNVDLRLAGFLAAGDSLAAIQALGPEYGLELSRDGLRRLARLLLDEQAPLRFTPLSLEIDPQLQRLLGMGSGPVHAARPRTGWFEWLVPSAHAAAASPAEPLRGLVPRLATLDDYLALVEELLAHEIDTHLDANPRLSDEHRRLFGPLVRATAWKETCWRHYVGRTDQPEVIRSPVGAVGMMQIMGRVWRGVYDIERLEADVQYNVAAGIKILEHYLVDYAVRRAEHEQPGGIDNLVRATYAAYNGGPSHLSRYRREQTPERLRAIDREFWRHFEQMKNQNWPDVASCYPVAG